MAKLRSLNQPSPSLACAPSRLGLLAPVVCALVSAAMMGCSTAMFTVTSDPLQADVYFQDPNSTDKAAEKKPLGKTPLTMTNAELKAALGPGISSGQYFPLIVEKSGFTTEVFEVPAARFGTMLTKLDVKLKAVPLEQSSKVQEKSAKAMVDRLFLAQKFALTQQFERAHAELDRLLVDFPDFARALSMRASIYYAQKNLPESLKWYEEALKLDPQMEEAVRMTAKIRNGQPGDALRLPAGQSGTPAAVQPAAPPVVQPAAPPASPGGGK